MTGTNLVLSSRRIISVLHSLPGLLPDCTDLQEPCLSNWSCLFWLLFSSCIFSTSENWVWFLSKFLHNTMYLLVPLHFPVALCHYMISLFWLGGMCVLNQLSHLHYPHTSFQWFFFSFFGVGVFFKKQGEGLGGVEGQEHTFSKVFCQRTLVPPP